MATKYGVGRAILHDVQKKETKVSGILEMNFGADRRKTLLVENCPKMGNALYIWFMQELSKYTLLSEEILKEAQWSFIEKLPERMIFVPVFGWLN